MGSANGTLTLQIGGDCPLTLTRYITVGAPEPALVATTALSCTSFGGTATINNFDPANTYFATTTGQVSFFGARSQVITSPSFPFKTGGGGSVGSIDIRVSNTCGSTTGGVTIDQSGCRPVAPTATLYPNPARETVDVHIENADAAHPVMVRLFDGYGQPRTEQTSTGAASVRLATGQLPAGLYFVHILRGQQVLSRQQLRIEK